MPPLNHVRYNDFSGSQMDSPRPGAPKVEAGHSRFGESRFGSSRFGQGRSGTWVEEGAGDAQGRVSGWYKAGPDAQVTGLTVVRPAPPAAPPVAKPPAPADAAPTVSALHLPGGRHGVLLFHGLASNPLELKFVARGLHRAGYTVRVAVLEGYSANLPSSGPSGHAQWAQAALAEFDKLKPHCDTLAVGGLCIGALLSLHVAAQRGPAVSHVLALSTTLHYDGWAAPKSRWLLPLARVMKWVGRLAVQEREPFGLKDKRLRAWMAGQIKESSGGEERATVKRVRDLVEAQNLMRLVRQGMKQVKAPTLLIHARDDDCASPRSAFEVASGVSSERVHCVLLSDSYHLITIDQEKARVLDEMKDFLQSVNRTAEVAAAPPVKSAAPETSRSSEHVRA